MRSDPKMILRAINCRAWELAQAEFEKLREELISVVAKGEITTEEISEWAPATRAHIASALTVPTVPLKEKTNVFD